MRYDAVIVGASVAGAAAAALLARQGLRIALLDKARFPRDKVCGEGLMPAGVGILREMGVLARLTCGQSFQGIRFIEAESGATVELDFSLISPDLRGRAFPRLALDGALAEFAAESPGVEWMQETQADSVRVNRSGVEVCIRRRGGRRTIQGRLLIGANGIRSRLPRRFAIKRHIARHRRFALRARFDRYRGDTTMVDVHCHRAGEAYVAPQPQGGALVTMLLHHRGSPLGGAKPQSFLRLLDGFPRLQAELEGSRTPSQVQAAAPLGQRLERCHGRRLLLLGDAAGAVDPVTGQGMSIALKDARLAADLLARRLPEGRLDEADLSDFSRRRNEYFLPAYRMAEDLISALRHPFLARRTLRSLNRNLDLRRKILAQAAQDGPPAALAWTDKLRLVMGF
ncbi:MAG TPA: FAD-dependent monooxygenase [Acidobacteriota bacterium]|nr:FAD-dependent monooxygenase [Acidobacteriota bacterium]